MWLCARYFPHKKQKTKNILLLLNTFIYGHWYPRSGHINWSLYSEPLHFKCLIVVRLSFIAHTQNKFAIKHMHSAQCTVHTIEEKEDESPGNTFQITFLHINTSIKLWSSWCMFVCCVHQWSKFWVECHIHTTRGACKTLSHNANTHDGRTTQMN